MSKVMWVGSSLEGGGAERSTALLATELQCRLSEVSIFLTAPSIGWESIDNLDRVTIFTPPSWSVSSPMRIFRWGVALASLLMALHREKPDFLFSFLPGPSFLSLVASRFVRCRVVVFERTFPPLAVEPRWVAVLRRLLYQGAECLVMQTDVGREWAERQFPKLRVLSIPNGVVLPVPLTSEPIVRPSSLVLDGSPVLLAVGRLVPEKRFDVLIDAFSMVESSGSDWVLVILGGGPMELQLREKILRARLKGKVVLTGPVGNVQEWYERASLFCSVSEVEGYPNALLEALANGLPAIAVDCPTGPREILSEGKRGILLPLDSPVTVIADTILSLIDQPRVRASYSRRAREVIETNSLEKIVDVMEEQILGVLKT